MVHPTRNSVTLLALALASAGCSSVQARKGPPNSQSARAAQSTDVREQTADQQIHHVLNRLAFGARPGDVQKVRAMGVDAWIEQQLHPERIADTGMSQLVSSFKSLSMSSTELIEKYPPPGAALTQFARKGNVTAADSMRIRESAREGNQLLQEVNTAKIARAVGSERQLNEVMVDFWENHFNVFAGKGRTRYLIPEYSEQVIRPNALGKFRTLLGAVAKSNAMLYYLDNFQSSADSGRPVLMPNGRVVINSPRARRGARTMQAPPPQQRRRGLNENYARELMELHTLGVDGGYTQQDVIDVARALTGWTTDGGPNGGEFIFRPTQHDAGAKTILGNQFPAGHGVDEGERVLDILARHPATARYISFKIARRLVSDTPSSALVDRAAATFTRTDGDIREVVRTIVTSPEFFAASAFRAKVKSPFEVVVSTLRAMGAPPSDVPALAQFVSRLGQPLFGHQAPNGYPETGDAWINAGAILNRINFGLAAASGRVPGVRLVAWPATRELASLPREQQVDGVIRELLGGYASADTRTVLVTGTNPFLESRGGIDTLMSANDTSATSGSNMNGGAGGDAMGAAGGRVRPNGKPPAKNGGGRQGGAAGARAQQMMSNLPDLKGLGLVVGLALGAPEFQRR